MFDTMTITKAAASLFGAMLVFLLTAWLSASLFHTGGDGEQAFIIPTGAEDVAEEEIVAEVPFDEVYAQADASAGERLFRACAACHRLEDGANGTGPHLFGVVDRPKHAVGDFSYSSAMLEQEGAWTPENLNAFLENPRGYVSGTSMSYNGMRDIGDRADLIAYLATFGG
jgi:cytochrome c